MAGADDTTPVGAGAGDAPSARGTAPMRLYDTRLGEVVDFEPGPLVTMYVCGITPYDATHLGHAAAYVTYDLLQRRLIDRGHEVRCVRNITDVDDDLLLAARQRGVHYLDLAFGQKARFDDDMAALNTLAPWSEPRATGAIADIRGVIAAIFERGLAYEIDGLVFFDTAADAGFGSTGGTGRSLLGLRPDAPSPQQSLEPDHPAKRSREDFVLWRPSAPGEPAWESRWGPGRPGWHVECSALALRELGETIDLQGGGVDLLYPHHECVDAQCRAATGKPFARHWMHQAMVHLDGRKMSKSDGNLVFVHELRRRVPGAVIRLALSTHHYRRPWNWTDDLIDEALLRRQAWSAAGPGDAGLDEVRAALDDDLDVAAALAAVDRHAAAGVGVADAAALLGVRLDDPAGASPASAAGPSTAAAPIAGTM